MRPRPPQWPTIYHHLRHNHNKIDHGASSQLFLDAAREEAEQSAESAPPSPSHAVLGGQDKPWDGDEPIQDAILRMLVDKYRPLRGGSIRSAEEKIKDQPPQVRSTSTPHADQSLLPAVEGHQPWHTTYKAPSSNIKTGLFGAPSPPSAIRPPMDERAKKVEKEGRKRMARVGRLTKAKESTLDYRLGVRPTARGAGARGVLNPVTLRGWNDLIEDRIERARMAGQFANIKGRGQPLVAETAESNPFIAREEFLLNRIVQRNGAAPPWVELQGEMEAAISAFRRILRQSWTQRALRILFTNHSHSMLTCLSARDVMRLRDAEWEAREKAYHDKALDAVNNVVRRYNAMAPYAVRKPYFVRGLELEKLYEDCREDIIAGIQNRLVESPGQPQNEPAFAEKEADRDTSIAGNANTLGNWVRSWYARWTH